jgi:hypothetical protein
VLGEAALGGGGKRGQAVKSIVPPLL